MYNIYLVANANENTGGPESIHQLAYYLNSMGYNAYLYYHDDPNTSPALKFMKYNPRTCVKIDDTFSNIIIVPETLTPILIKYKYIKKCIWWLSLDFYKIQFPKEKTKHMINELGFSKQNYVLLYLRNIFSCNKYNFKFDDDSIFHLYNCKYVKDYLLNNKIDLKKMSYLCGPLADQYFDKQINFEKKKRIVTYNPKKGIAFTRKMVEQLEEKDILCLPLQNLTQEEMIETLLESMVYMDFGFFPGPERIPREAVMLGCNLVTSKKGSAENLEDIYIPDQFKFQLVDVYISDIVTLIIKMMDEYTEYYHFFNDYRNKIISQKINFKRNIMNFIKKVDF